MDRKQVDQFDGVLAADPEADSVALRFSASGQQFMLTMPLEAARSLVFGLQAALELSAGGPPRRSN